MNYDYNVLVPTLTSEQFKRLYLDVIKLKVEHGEVVTDFPRPTFSPCSAYTRTTWRSLQTGDSPCATP